jgi:dihydroorotase
VRREALRSQGKNTPFLGLQVTGSVHATVVGGAVVFERTAKE